MSARGGAFRERLMMMMPLVIGIALLAGAAWALWSELSFRSIAAMTEARIADLQPSTSTGSDGRSSTTYYPVFEFALPDGRMVRAVGPIGSGTPCCEVGDIVTIRYDPAQPQRAAQDSFVDSWLVTTVLGGFGAIVTAAGILVLAMFGSDVGWHWRRRPVIPERGGDTSTPVPTGPRPGWWKPAGAAHRTAAAHPIARDGAGSAPPSAAAIRINGLPMDGSSDIGSGMPALLLAIGGLFLAGATALAWPTIAFINGSATVEGRVVDMARGPSPVFVFTPPGGTELRVTSAARTDPPCCEVGETVTVRYRPGNPRDARIASLQDFWLWPGVLAGFGLVWFVPGLIMLRAHLLWGRRQQRRLHTAATEGLRRRRPAAPAPWPVATAPARRTEGSPSLMALPLAGLRRAETPSGPRWFVQARWTDPSNGAGRLFESEPLPFDPVPQMRDMSTVSVVFDPSDPHGPHDMDLSFLRAPAAGPVQPG